MDKLDQGASFSWNACNDLYTYATSEQVIIDADDLPLNVSRETLQSQRFLKKIKNIVVSKFLQVNGLLLINL
jgi:HSP90 family molecular chaperone